MDKLYLLPFDFATPSIIYRLHVILQQNLFYTYVDSIVCVCVPLTLCATWGIKPRFYTKEYPIQEI